MEDKILETVVSKLPYAFEKDVLVKPLDPIMIDIEYTEQVPNGKKDEDGNNLYDTKKSIKKEESDFTKGIILAMPTCLTALENKPSYTVGDTVIYSKKFAKSFDIYKNSQLIKPYDVIAKVIK